MPLFKSMGCSSQSCRVRPGVHCPSQQREISNWRNEPAAPKWWILSLKGANSSDPISTCLKQRLSKAGLMGTVGSGSAGLPTVSAGLFWKNMIKMRAVRAWVELCERECVADSIFPGNWTVGPWFQMLYYFWWANQAGWGSDNACPHCYRLSCGLDIEHLNCFGWETLMRWQFWKCWL